MGKRNFHFAGERLGGGDAKYGWNSLYIVLINLAMPEDFSALNA